MEIQRVFNFTGFNPAKKKRNEPNRSDHMSHIPKNSI